MAVLAESPRSAISRIDYGHRREKAEQVLESLLSILSIPACYSKFTSTLPLTRICVLLLGDNPAPVVATQVLSLIAMSLRISSSFSRKLELVDGWSILRIVVPSAWDPSVHQAVFDILLGRTSDQVKAHTTGTTVVCPNIVPTIFAALSHGLDTIAKHSPPETLSVDDVPIGAVSTTICLFLVAHPASQIAPQGRLNQQWKPSSKKSSIYMPRVQRSVKSLGLSRRPKYSLMLIKHLSRRSMPPSTSIHAHFGYWKRFLIVY